MGNRQLPDVPEGLSWKALMTATIKTIKVCQPGDSMECGHYRSTAGG